MLGLIRFFAIGFVVLSVVYVSLSLYSRAARREKLQEEWEDTPDSSKEAFIKAGMAEYDKSLRKRLILGVYVVPLILLGTILYLTNYA